MKKTIILLFIAVFTIGYTQAQQNKQVAGSKNLEVLFAPLGGNPVSIGGIKYRAFSSETSAFRVTVFLGYQSETSIVIEQDENSDDVELKDKTGTFDISIRPGIEKHFTGTDRLSPYVGGELLLGMNKEKSVMESYDLGEEEIYENIKKDGMLTFGVNAVAGVDYYFAQNIYLGAEFGFGLAFNLINDTKEETTINDGPDDIITPNGSSFSVGPNAVGQIRLGWLF